MESSITCKTCSKRVLISDIKADKSGAGWICFNCYKSQHPKLYSKEAQQKEKERMQLKPKKIKYYCSECSYKFYKEGKFIGKCPYCNLYTIKEDKDANTLLREVMDEEKTGFNKPRIEIID